MGSYTRRTVVGGGLSVVALGGVGVTVSGEGADSEEGGGDESGDEEGAVASRVRVAHFAPDVRSIEVSVGEDHRLELERFSIRSTDEEIEPGTHRLSIEGEEGLLVEEKIDVGDGPLTVVVLGEACAVGDRALSALRIEDDHRPTPEGLARIQGVHASPDAPTVDVTLGEETIISSLEFGDHRTIELPPGEATIEVHAAEGDGAGESLGRFSIEPEAGRVYSAFGVGYVDPESAPEEADGPSFALAISEDAAPGEAE
ncbi:DUF4397 domain-containing protein [Natronorarus salvus]|uniref:DUF4397 domain-containing protein n=1 Tax=Natronorarus salvus TaxID=3117733 RepID=UPI002F26B76F